MAITDWQTESDDSSRGNHDGGDVISPKELDVEDDVYETFPGLDPIRW